MDAYIEELSPKVIGKRLGQNLYSSKGSLLLRRGAEIQSVHFGHLKEVGYQSVYVQNGGDLEFDSNWLIISEELRAKAPPQIREIFRRLASSNRGDLVRGKQEIMRLADQLLKNVSFRPEMRVRYLDLKRRDDYLYQHALNVALYAILIGHSLHYHQLKMMDLTLGALLHDFGKVLVDERLLIKSTPLDEQEMAQYREHTVKGFQHLGRQCQLSGLVTIAALQHHEHYDGNGYPRGLSGNDIHEFSRIVAIADFFDTFTSDRHYRRLHSIEEAAEELRAQSGKQFDPELTAHFLKFLE